MNFLNKQILNKQILNKNCEQCLAGSSSVKTKQKIHKPNRFDPFLQTGFEPLFLNIFYGF